MIINAENSGLIFKNDRKDNERQPDYKGSVNVCGKQMEIALWVKENNRGKFMSAKFSEPYAKPEDAPPPPAREDENIGRETMPSHYKPEKYGKDDSVPFALLFAFVGLSFAIALCGQIMA